MTEKGEGGRAPVPTPAGEIIPLSTARPGEKVEIVDVRAGRGLYMRLANMGFYPGTSIEVVSNVGRGPMIVARGGIRLALGFGMAQKVFVRIRRDRVGAGG